MKSRLIALSFLLATSLLSGCGATTNKIVLTYGDQTLDSYIRLSREVDLTSKIDNKENFILVSYADESCACWAIFESRVVIPYVQQYDIPIYVIHADLISDVNYYGLPINSTKENTPVVGLYENGVYRFGTSYNNDNSVFKNLNSFVTYVDRYMTRPYGYYINLDQLNTLLKGDERFIINWGMSICPDCKIFDHTLLKDYLKANTKQKDTPLYIIETVSEGLRLVDGVSDSQHWQDQKDIYGLSATLNTEYGYRTGFVPTLQVINPDGTDYVALGDISPVIEDQIVFQNESVAYDENSDKYLVSESYFDGVRGRKYLGDYPNQIGLEIDEEFVYEQNDTLRFMSEARYDIQQAFAKKFLDTYWR